MKQTKVKTIKIEEIKRYFTMTRIAMRQYDIGGVMIQLDNLEKNVIESLTPLNKPKSKKIR